MDYLAALAKMNYGCQGHASIFCLLSMDRAWTEGLTRDKVVDFVDKRIKELQSHIFDCATEFPHFKKVIDQDGEKTLKFGADGI